MGSVARGIALAAMTLVLAACAEVDDTTGSRLTQPPPGAEPHKPVDMGDVAIVGQEVSHAIMDLPVVANATTPPLVQFTGVTSIINGPVDTEPYTNLLRDRLLLLTREKLRFIERTLPPLVVTQPKKSKKKKASPTPEASTTPDYEILAELRGKFDDKLYKIQIQFTDAHTGDILFDGLYRIHKEVPDEASIPVQSTEPMEEAAPAPPAAPPPTPDPDAQPAGTGTPPLQ